MDENGEFYVDRINAQDVMVLLTQGEISDRSTEHLGTSDQGVVLYRRTLLQQLDRVRNGEDPLGVIRDPERNTPWIDVPHEDELHYSIAGLRNSARDMMAGSVPTTASEASSQ
jgi:5,5'-dehydrodivanillate O-demethylase